MREQMRVCCVMRIKLLQHEAARRSRRRVGAELGMTGFNDGVMYLDRQRLLEGGDGLGCGSAQEEYE